MLGRPWRAQKFRIERYDRVQRKRSVRCQSSTTPRVKFFAIFSSHCEKGSQPLPSPIAMMHSLRELDATPQQIGVFVGECLDVAAKAAMEIAEGVREAGKTLRDQEPDFDVPDDLSDLE